MKMTKKDFEELADILSGYGASIALVERVAKFCAKSNENFDQTKFVARGTKYLYSNL